MGGGESSSPPTDLLGGQYASFSGGTPLPDYSALGQGVSKGMQQFGGAIANQPQQNYMTGATIPQQQNYQGASLPPTLIPSVQDLKQNSKNDLAEAIQRLMASGGAQSNKLRQAWDWNFRTSGVPTQLLQPNFNPYMGLV